MKQIIFFRKMHSNQEMLDYKNRNPRRKFFWCGNGALEGHYNLPTKSFGLDRFGVCPLNIIKVSGIY